MLAFIGSSHGSLLTWGKYEAFFFAVSVSGAVLVRAKYELPDSCPVTFFLTLSVGGAVPEGGKYGVPGSGCDLVGGGAPCRAYLIALTQGGYVLP